MLAGALLLMVLLAWVPATASADAPKRADVQTQLEDLQSVEKPDADTRQRIADLKDTLTVLDDLAEATSSLNSLKSEVKEAPAELAKAQAELARLPQDYTPPSIASLEDESVEALDKRMTSILDSLQNLQDKLADTNRRLINAQSLPERSRSTLADAQQQVQRLQTQLGGSGDADLSGTGRDLIEARLALAETRGELSHSELNSSSLLRELAQVRKTLYSRQIANLEQDLEQVQTLVNDKRRNQSEQTIADATSGENAALADNPIFQQVLNRNRELSSQLLAITDRVNAVIRDGLEVRTQLDRVTQVERTMSEQIEAIKGSVLLARILREQQSRLPQVDVRKDLKEEIADLRLKQFELNKVREQLADIPGYLNSYVLGEAAALERPGGNADVSQISAELRQALIGQLEARKELVDKLDKEYDSLLARAIDLQLNQQQLLEVSGRLRQTIEEQLFWVANGKPLDLDWLSRTPEMLAEELRPNVWRGVVAGLSKGFQLSDLWVALPGLLLLIFITWKRSRIRARLADLHAQIGRLKQDTQLHTPRAILLNVLLAIPGALALALIGGVLSLGEGIMLWALGQALLKLSLAWGIFAIFRRLLVKDGVAERHFQWPANYVAELRRHIWWLGFALLPVVLTTNIISEADLNLLERPLGLAILFVGLMAMSFCLSRLILAHVPFFGLKLFRLILGLAMALVPVALGVLICLGYEYTALRLCGRFITTIFLFGAWILVEATVVRGLAVAARRLAYRRAVARRRAQVQEGAEGGVEVVEEPPLDMEQVNSQSLRLSKLILVISFLSIFYVVWADLLNVLSYLDSVVVWEIAASVEGDSATPISLADLIAGMITLAVAVMMARNLPGLLEVSILSRLELKQGSSYAITSLLSYVIMATGFVMTLGSMGVSWDKLQWLVAALSVGLGFGLQEIFANFISGLIILFERPVRIGDTITIGNLHGTVNRIRIRATTVTDFDRKEIIIPNKVFVTDQLINWSLSDNVTRVVLNFGVAHGSDLDLAHRLLMQAAQENRRVLKDPEPLVFCLTYNQDNFGFELRIYVNDLTDRLYATDEINRWVDARFREHGLKVAFQQMDVWLHRDDGTERLVEQRSASAEPLRPASGSPESSETESTEYQSSEHREGGALIARRKPAEGLAGREDAGLREAAPDADGGDGGGDAGGR
ncbi:MAG: mechanosensitive channel MscK [Cobetia sp.]|nr:mechanosensitive channel MscK [Halomonas sp. SF2003]MBF10040.1 mechanosensitive channel MscK [Cobetia sp.]MBR9798983.1 mechanosensitive channel MscK [Gammaproteobacteria bacterium]TCJ27802.1 mechanosensitive channel MscK [Halomonas sp. GDM18]UTV86184.1 mechanosensitive channel MscK [Cobetia litoralis]|tara:strand:+ start:14147 stop:17662 length:3516 start_codon:yes stop_codon:yes gene_type:complete